MVFRGRRTEVYTICKRDREEAARLLNFTYVKLHALDISDIEILQEVFPFVSSDVVHNLELEKSAYNIAASNADIGHDLWAFWHDNSVSLQLSTC